MIRSLTDAFYWDVDATDKCVLTPNHQGQSRGFFQFIERRLVLQYGWKVASYVRETIFPAFIYSAFPKSIAANYGDVSVGGTDGQPYLC